MIKPNSFKLPIFYFFLRSLDRFLFGRSFQDLKFFTGLLLRNWAILSLIWNSILWFILAGLTITGIRCRIMGNLNKDVLIHEKLGKVIVDQHQKLIFSDNRLIAWRIRRQLWNFDLINHLVAWPHLKKE